jgi:hypothetical protein
VDSARTRSGEQLRVMFTSLGCRLDADPVLPAAAACPIGDALAAIEFAASMATRRWSGAGLTVSGPQLAVSASGGLLLSTGFVPEPIHTSWLWQRMR